MPIIRAQVVIPMFTNIPSDVITNTFHFRNENPLAFSAAATLIAANLETFYEDVYGGTGHAANYVLWPQTYINFYDLSQPAPRAPLTIAQPIIVTPTATIVPTEAAVVLSFQGPRESGTPQSRRRGRVYLGGLGSAWLSNSTASGFPMVPNTPLVNLTGAAATLVADSVADALPWCVWSPTDQEATNINNGWVDNTIDTQRRRGVAASSRTTWSV